MIVFAHRRRSAGLRSTLGQYELANRVLKVALLDEYLGVRSWLRLFSNSGLKVKLSMLYLSGSLFSPQ